MSQLLGHCNELLTVMTVMFVCVCIPAEGFILVTVHCVR